MIGAVALLYTAAGRAGLLLASAHGSVSPVFPATGVAVGALCLGGLRMWPAVAVGALLTNLMSHATLPVALLIAAGNTLEAVVGALLWRRVPQRWPGLREFDDVTGAAVAAFVAPVTSATIGVLALGLAPSASREIGELWVTWWTGDALGVLSVAPVMLTAGELLHRIRRARWADAARAAAVLGAAAGISWLAFAHPNGALYLFGLFPVLMLAAVWFGAPGARLIALLVAIAGIMAAVSGRGPFVTPELNQNLLNLQVFLASVAITALALPAFRAGGNMVLPVLVLLGGWTLSGWMFVLIQQADVRREEQFFTDRVAEAQAAILVRMNSYIDALRGGTSFFSAAKTVQREDWRVYAESLDIDKRLPAINGIGVIFVVPPDQTEAWLARARADGVPEARIAPFPDTKEMPGDPYYLVTYLAPASRNNGTFGRNIATEPTRRAAADAARDSGEPRLHHRALGSRDLLRRSGLLLYVPLYAKGMPTATVAQRRAAIQGWVYAQLFPDVLLKAVLGPAGDVLQLHFFEAGELRRDRLLYASHADPTDALPQFERVTHLDIAGQRFQLGWRRGPKFVVAEKSPAAWAAASFALATMLLAGLVVNLQAIGRRANKIAAKRTAELAASEERFRQAFEFAGIGVALSDLDGRWLRVNRALCNIVGYSENELLQKTFQEITHPDDRAADLTIMRDLVEGRQAVAEVTKRYFHRSGRVIWVRLIVSLVRDASGAPLHFVGQIEDITERRQLEENLARARDQALEASRLKSEFLANMSHEIRTPMNAVSGMIGLLAETNLTEEQRKMAFVIQGGADSLVTIINDILDFSRIEAGKLRLDPVDFDLRGLIEETAALLAAQAQGKGLTLACDISLPSPTPLTGDSGRVRQVLTNLIGNAIKFTERGRIDVLARIVGESSGEVRVRVEVRDTGIGVPEEAESYLFQPFTQADGSATRRHGGTGLGLAICRQILKAMGGEIAFTSTVGQGSTFWFEFELPRAEGKPEAAHPNVPADCRVLVVDDNADDQDLLRHELERIGVAATTLLDPRQALDHIRSAAAAGQPYHAVLLDCRMPGKSGIDLAIEIRADRAVAATPLVLLSAADAGDNPPGAASAGFDAFLTKPARRGVLQRCLARLTPLPELADEKMARPPGDYAETGKPLRLLVVEDNYANQVVARTLLAKMGHAVEVAENGELALAALAKQPYDAILMDCQMPVLDGFETTRRIRAGGVRGLDASIPIIAVTAYAMRDDRARCLAAGMTDYLTKPIRPEEVRAAFGRCGLDKMAPDGPGRAEAASQTTPILDVATVDLARTLPGERGPSLLPEIVGRYLDDEPAALAKLAALAEQGAAADLAVRAHAYAGNAASIGGFAARDAAVALERAARYADAGARKEALDQLLAEAARLRAALATLEMEPSR